MEQSLEPRDQYTEILWIRYGFELEGTSPEYIKLVAQTMIDGNNRDGIAIIMGREMGNLPGDEIIIAEALSRGEKYAIAYLLEQREIDEQENTIE